MAILRQSLCEPHTQPGPRGAFAACAGPVDQSLTASSFHSDHNSLGTSRRDNLSTTTGDHGCIIMRPSRASSIEMSLVQVFVESAT